MSAENDKALLSLIDRIFGIVSKQAATIAALQDCLMTHPDFDVVGYGELLKKRHAEVDAQLQKLGAPTPDALLAFLRDYQGPIQ